MHNWLMGRNVLFVSMEMNTLAVAQRAAAMYAHTNLSQLKIGGYPDSTYKLFVKEMDGAPLEKGKLYVIDGNLAADPEDIYTLGQQLQCSVNLIDGGYLLRHRNLRLDRYTKVAENVEAMKRYSTDLEIPTFASWQFNRDASKKKKGEKAGLEDIGYTDAIGQISTLVLGLMQEEGVETIQSRLIDVLKGRNGEVGQFRVNWDFSKMDFTQLVEGEQKTKPLDEATI
jgi:replicative DNA helicase